MKKVYRKLSWLLLLAMLIGLFATGVIAADAPETGTEVAAVWEGEAPVAEVKLDLYKGEDKVTVDPIVLEKDKEWKTKVTDFPVKDDEGNAIEYTAKIVEGGDALATYEATVSITDKDTVEVKLAPKTENKTPTGGNAAGQTSPSQNPEDDPSTSPSQNPEADPSASPSQNPEADPSTSPSQNPDADPTPDVPETVNMTVKVVWVDGENQDGIRPTELKVQLYNGETASGEPVTMKAGTDGNWNYAYTGLAKDGSWTAKAVAAPDGYTVTSAADEGGNVTITCTHTTATVEYNTSVVWNDGNDQLKQRPSSVQVQLYKVVTTSEGNKRVDVGTPVTLNSDCGWAYVFKDLPKFDGGTAITYKFTLVETPNHYTASYNFTTGVVKLSNSYKNNTTMDYKVTAKWVDNNNKYNKRPSSMSVTLYANGVKSKTITMKPDSSGNWNYTFEDIAEYKNGEKVNYEVKITAIPNYVSKVKYTTSNGVTTATITNTYSDIPLTGDSSNLAMWLALVLVAGVALGGMAGFRFYKNRA